MSKPKPIVLALLALLAGVVALFVVRSNTATSSPLAGVGSWHYQLQNIDRDFDRIAQLEADLLVVDFSMSQGAGRAMRPLSAEDVTRLRTKPGGGKRFVLAYFSIGEAEEYRYYWNPAWKDTPPDFLIAENCRWPRNHLVRFWHDGWKDIMIRGPQSYLARIQAAGFDGVYLDRVDVYDDIKDRHRDARARMIEFVAELADTARASKPGFLVVAQNAEDLIDEPRYRRLIDGLGKEDLLYGLAGTSRRNGDDAIGWSRKRLDQLRREGKPVFVAEYLTSRALVTAANVELRTLGYVGVFPTRALDGADPMTARPADVTRNDYGTPEFMQAHCNGVWK